MKNDKQESAEKIVGSTDGLETTLLKTALRLADRRMWLSSYVPRCSACGASRYAMQLTYWLDTPARWKCRDCQYVFECEPVVSNAKLTGPKSELVEGIFIRRNPLWLNIQMAIRETFFDRRHS